MATLFTVLCSDVLYQTGHYKGTFASVEKASEFAKWEAARSKLPHVFTVCEGIPENVKTKTEIRFHSPKCKR